MTAAAKDTPKKLIERQLGPIEIFYGLDHGKYPQGNSFIVRGEQRSALIDPSLGLVARKPNQPAADTVLYSHSHEDHLAGAHLYADKPCHMHREDASGLQSLAGLLAIFGISGGHQAFIESLHTKYHYQPRPDVQCFEDGEIFELGGVNITVVHTPGHTAGHCCFLVQWGPSAAERLVYLGDIDLTGFGPYYGDPASSLLEFEESMEKLRHIDAQYWLTFHHKGLIEDKDTFLQMLDSYEQVINNREMRLLDFISSPKTMAEIVDYRIVYRPGTGDDLVASIEQHSARMHLERLIAAGTVTLQDNHYCTQ